MFILLTNNILESLIIVSNTKSFRTNKDQDMIAFGEENSKVISVVCDEKYNKETNPITAAFKAMSYNYTELLHKDAIGEYQTDFVGYVRNDYLKNFYVLPDYLKGVKSGVQKATEKAKKNKNELVIRAMNEVRKNKKFYQKQF